MFNGILANMPVGQRAELHEQVECRLQIMLWVERITQGNFLVWRKGDRDATRMDLAGAEEFLVAEQKRLGEIAV